jgi:hypothetical protein
VSPTRPSGVRPNIPSTGAHRGGVGVAATNG